MYEFNVPFYGWAPVRSIDDERLLKNTYIPMCESREEDKMDISKMTKEEALKKIEELKVFIENLDKEIPPMPYNDNSDTRMCLVHPAYGAWQEYGKFEFKSADTCECYHIKAYELAHLMYAREFLNLVPQYFCKYRLFFNPDKLEYYVIDFDRHNNYSSNGVYESINLWLFPDEDSARKVSNYMNKYVKDKVKEMY